MAAQQMMAMDREMSRCPQICDEDDSDEEDVFTDHRREELKRELAVAMRNPSTPRWRFEYWGTQLAIAYDSTAVLTKRTGPVVSVYFGNVLLGDDLGTVAVAWMRCATVQGKVDICRVDPDQVGAVDCVNPPFEHMRLENLGVTVQDGSESLELVSRGGTLGYDALRQCFGGFDFLPASAE